MAYSSVYNDVHTCIKGGIPSRVPCFPIGVMYDYYHFGYTHRQWRESPEIMVDVCLKTVQEFDFDIYMLHPDDLLEYEQFGMDIRDDEDIPPAVEQYLEPKAGKLKDFHLPEERFFKSGRPAIYLEGIRKLRRIR